MRDILEDLDAGRFLSDPDPVRRARQAMRTPLPKRFYEAAEAKADGDAWKVMLDGRPVRTPAGKQVVLPAQALA
jgi:chaperone required for assembly of F1-ATPase